MRYLLARWIYTVQMLSREMSAWAAFIYGMIIGSVAFLVVYVIQAMRVIMEVEK